MQETLTRGVAAAVSWTPGTDLRAWLFRIMHNAWLYSVRQRGTRDRWEAEWPNLAGRYPAFAPRGPEGDGGARRPARTAAPMRPLALAFEDMHYADAARAMNVPLET